MKYFHCPKLRWGKEYGCGYGPVNGTVAFLDLYECCPQCGMKLRHYRGITKKFRQSELLSGLDTVRTLFGDKAAQSYAKEKGLDK